MSTNSGQGLKALEPCEWIAPGVFCPEAKARIASALRCTDPQSLLPECRSLVHCSEKGLEKDYVSMWGFHLSQFYCVKNCASKIGCSIMSIVPTAF